MIYLRRNTIRFRRGNGRRGSVIVLVVAVLALLAVIGTVYIVSSRAERGSAQASSSAENLDLAQQSVQQQYTQVINDAAFDANGVIGGGNVNGGFGFGIARRHDNPEFNINQAGQATYNDNARDQSWLAAGTYRMYRLNPQIPFNEMSMPQGRMPATDASNNSHAVPALFDPSTGAYDINLLSLGGTPGAAQFSSGTPVFSDVPGSTSGLFRVVADPLPQINLPDGSQCQAGTNGQTGDDAFVQLLPFSEANGIRYRFGIRIIDTNRMANLNVGDIYDITSPGVAQSAGMFYNGYALNSPAIFDTTNPFYTAADVPLAINGTVGLNNPGRLGSFNPSGTIPAAYAYQQAGFRFEDPSLFPTSPFDLSDELELRAYGVFGTVNIPRPAKAYGNFAVWPNTLGNRAYNSNSPTGNLHRGFYTAYSYSRDLRQQADPVDGTGNLTAYQLIPPGGAGTWAVSPPSGGNSSVIWPMFPARVAANPDISVYTGLNNQQCSEMVTIAAVNIATAMEKIANYDKTEALAYASSYMTSRWNSWVDIGSKTVGGKTIDHVYNLPAGPSFIDVNGPCLRAWDAAANAPLMFNFTSDLKTDDNTHTYVGFAAQPFINECAIEYKSVPSGGIQHDDSAVELYNPYDVALSLQDYKLNVGGADVLFTADDCIPPKSFYVISKNAGGTFDAAVDSAAVKSSNNALDLFGANKVLLMRKYFDRLNAPAWATVDQYGVASISTLPGQAEVDFVARGNSSSNQWSPTVHVVATAEAKHVAAAAAPDLLTLGAINDSTNAVTFVVPLNDRTLDMDHSYGFSTDYQRSTPLNIVDFDKIMRIANVVNPSDATVPGSPQAVVSMEIGANPVVGADFPEEAGVRFDFKTIPNLFQNPAVAPPTSYNAGDVRAVRLLNCLSFADRVSDYSINLGDNNSFDRGLSKLRVPGQINVNTAPPEVLASLPVVYSNPSIAGYILAYRWRTNTADPRIPPGFQSSGATGYDFSSNTEFPGFGVRSMGELAVPLQLWAKANNKTYVSIAERDQYWARLYNALTVRSDTFVVYAYLEAVRQNPRYTGTFNNSTDWYATNSAASAVPIVGVSDDPNDRTHALQRVARRRWIDIVDRSTSNFSRYTVNSLPPVLDPRYTPARVVAHRDLPQ